MSEVMDQSVSVERHPVPSLGFTLLELLVVVAIIGILVSIMLPALSGVKNKALLKKLDSDLRSIAVACRTYHTEYGYWPGKETKTYLSTDVTFMAKLTARDNDRHINFIEWQPPTMPDDPGMVDPLRPVKGGDRSYHIAIDVDANSVRVWSIGLNGRDDFGASKADAIPPQDDIQVTY